MTKENKRPQKQKGLIETTFKNNHLMLFFA